MSFLMSISIMIIMTWIKRYISTKTYAMEWWLGIFIFISAKYQ